ncbi:MAG TPA: Os1348 family NHLP clan protein [Terriglobales bacterium]|jgi:hypothetical protein|nr:Os1348 family NHLP clan protein [Terriglobales bacterium]
MPPAASWHGWRLKEGAIAMAVTFQQLVEHVMTDSQFRQQFVKDPVAAAESFGVNMTDSLKRALQKLPMQAIQDVAVAMRGPAAPMDAAMPMAEAGTGARTFT